MRLIAGRLGALLAILAVLLPCWRGLAIQQLATYDQPFYLGIAYDLVHEGVFTDGYMFAAADASGRRPPGMRFTPLYPAFLAAIATLDPALRQGMDCEVRSRGKNTACPRAAPLPRSVQFAMLAGFFWLLWWMVRAVATTRTAWLALGLSLITAPMLMRSVGTLMTEIFSLFFFTAATALALQTLRHDGAARYGYALLTGIVLGLAALVRPAFVYLAPLMAFGAVLLAVPRTRLRRTLPVLGVLLAGLVLTLLPWMLRNAAVLHRFALTFGYASHTLVQRISFDSMTPREYAMSFVCWLPDGSGLGTLLQGRQACDRFGWDDHPDSFYAIGMGPLMRRTLAASGGWNGHMHYLLHHYIFHEPVKHTLVTVPLALRGLYIDHYWGLLLAPLAVMLTGKALRRGRMDMLLLSIPAWTLLLLNAAVAVNQPRYNLMLITPFALAGALAIETRIGRWRRSP